MELTLVGPPSRTVTRVLGIAACLTVTAVAACNGTDRTTTARSPSAGRSSPQLTKPIEQYTSGEFQIVVSGLYFGGSDVDDAVPAATSIADTSAVDTIAADSARPPGAVLIIEAMSTANAVSLADPGPNGTIIARLRNLHGNDDTFGTQPGASFEYYVVMKPNGAVEIAELTRAKNPTGHPQKVSEGTIQRCDPNEDAPAYSSARFGGCEHGARSASAQRTTFLGIKTLWAQNRGGSAWVSCKEGCCELTMATLADS